MSEIFWIFIAIHIIRIKERYSYNATIAFSKSPSYIIQILMNVWKIF